MFQPSMEEKPGFIFYFSFLAKGLGPAYIESIEFAGDASLYKVETRFLTKHKPLHLKQSN